MCTNNCYTLTTVKFPVVVTRNKTLWLFKLLRNRLSNELSKYWLADNLTEWLIRTLERSYPSASLSVVFVLTAGSTESLQKDVPVSNAYCTANITVFDVSQSSSLQRKLLPLVVMSSSSSYERDTHNRTTHDFRENILSISQDWSVFFRKILYLTNSDKCYNGRI
jgi:hypothetical protein